MCSALGQREAAAGVKPPYCRFCPQEQGKEQPDTFLGQQRVTSSTAAGGAWPGQWETVSCVPTGQLFTLISHEVQFGFP